MKFVALLFAIISAFTSIYAALETAPNYISGLQDRSTSYRYYSERPTLQLQSMIAGITGLLALFLGRRARQNDGGSFATAVIYTAIVGLFGAVHLLLLDIF